MSAQFGRWCWRGESATPAYFDKVSVILAPFGPDASNAYIKDNVGILYRASFTTSESRHEQQPHISSSGVVITWDGRLDNRLELINDLSGHLNSTSTDVEIVAAAYNKWRTNSFGKLIGDWALSIWEPTRHSLILAKDPLGVRHLYYLLENHQVTWSSFLDPLLKMAGTTFTLCDEYLAGLLSNFPSTTLTPYTAILAVPPSAYVICQPTRYAVTKYWDFDPNKTIRYRTDSEYEEHFRAVFFKAIQRRLRSDSPVLAELSGGVDSSSIVCAADVVIDRGGVETPRLDTISWFSGHIPEMDERSYFSKVEQKRGRVGYHIDLDSIRELTPQQSFIAAFQDNRLAPTPFHGNQRFEFFRLYAAHVTSHGYRVVLSGIGGDEITGGGVPSSTPSLENLLARGRFIALAKQLKAWSLKIGKSPADLLLQTVRSFLPCAIPVVSETPWLNHGFRNRHRASFRGHPLRISLFGPLPSFQENMRKLDYLRRILAHISIQSKLLCELCFPYLDRDVLEFMYAVPGEQIVRVGQRRSLLRRALQGIVPSEILHKKVRRPSASVIGNSTEWPSPDAIGQHLVSSSLGIIDQIPFREVLQRAREHQSGYVNGLGRALTLESWLRHILAQHGSTNADIRLASIARFGTSTSNHSRLTLQFS